MKRVFYIMTTVLLMAGLSGCFDDSDLQNDVDDLKQRVLTLEEKVSKMNGEIGAMQTIVTALNSGNVITSVTETTTGYTITFSGGSTITVNHGSNGADGAAAPVIGVDESEGVYYWTLTLGGETSWLLDAKNEKIPVTGAAPVMGVDADGYWTVNGVQLLDTEGQSVKASGEDGDSFFKNVTQDENAVTFTLANDTEIVVPKAENLQLRITGGSLLILQYGETATRTVNLTGSGSVIITKPDGWRANIQEGILSVTAPPQANAYAEKDGTISITVVGKSATVNSTITVSVREYGSDYNYVIDFEGVGENYLAGPTSYGENLYSNYVGINRYTKYQDASSGLYMFITDFYGDDDPEDIEYYWGGTAISRWNDMTTAGHTNQCSVYYSDPSTGMGGYNGSNTFAVTYLGMSGIPPEVSYRNDLNGTDKECVFDHFYVTNNTYAVLSMKLGDQFRPQPFNYTDKDFLKLIIRGYDKSGGLTNTVEAYLADFRTPTSPGIITEWIPVDLLPLGKVASMTFDMESRDGVGSWGMGTPVYFCFDNLAIKQ